MIRSGECQPDVCGAACCRQIKILDYKDDDQPDWLDFLAAREIIVSDRDAWQVLTIQHVCPQLHENRCLVHDVKPKVCLNFPEHPSQMPEGCTYTFDA